MKKNTFESFKNKKLNKEIINSMAGEQYLANAEAMNKEINYINKRNANAKYVIYPII